MSKSKDLWADGRCPGWLVITQGRGAHSAGATPRYPASDEAKAKTLQLQNERRERLRELKAQKRAEAGR